ncbi:DHRS7B isoform 6 [Pongo abelii]|uniref:DHRS7B isoform 6 n=1 Tax=Pongo abelii TaxID=9601 RepID=A0A2J8R472_PONAB|nr:DHRS7B isoform 6 [Pongo abelii]
MVSLATRKSLPKVKAMDFITSTAILPLLFSCLGVFGLFRLLQWVRGKAYLRNAVVVITGATSGLGKGADTQALLGDLRPHRLWGRSCSSS